MIRLTSVILILVMSCHFLVNMGVFTYYQLNKDYIAEVLCINRDKPEVNCNGKCFLTEKLAQAGQSEGEELPVSQQQKIEIPSFLICHYQFLFESRPDSHPVYHLSADNISLPLLSFAVFQPPRV